MAYDYTGAWTSYTGHAQNLYPSPNDDLSTPFNTTHAIEYYISQGVEVTNINLGNPLYGHAFHNTTGLGKEFQGVGTGGLDPAAGTWNYKQLPLPGSNATVTEFIHLGASYSYDPLQKIMISYDTPAIAKQKGHYIMARGLGGAMWWEISGDKVGKESLVAAVVSAFDGFETSQNHLEYPKSPYLNLRNGFPGE